MNTKTPRGTRRKTHERLLKGTENSLDRPAVPRKGAEGRSKEPNLAATAGATATAGTAGPGKLRREPYRRKRSNPP